MSLTKTEYLLDVLMEECAEVIQRASKAIRFGLHEVQPGQTKDNSQRLVEEYCNLLITFEGLVQEASIYCEGNIFAELTTAKKVKLAEFMNYSQQLGILTND